MVTVEPARAQSVPMRMMCEQRPPLQIFAALALCQFCLTFMHMQHQSCICSAFDQPGSACDANTMAARP